MLSFLYRLTRAFYAEHGYRPNVVMMNGEHYRLLQESLPDVNNGAELSRLLGMDVILSEDCIHPHVGWRVTMRYAIAGG